MLHRKIAWNPITLYWYIASVYAKYDWLCPDHVALSKSKYPSGQLVNNCCPQKSDAEKLYPTADFFKFIE